MKPFTRVSRHGFTLIELLTAIAILAIIVLAMSQLLISAQSASASSHRLLDADDEARLVFARMSNDFSNLVNRNDVDMIIDKQAVGTDGNDKMFFYSQAVGDSTDKAGGQNPVSLAGYLVAADPNVATGAGPIVFQRLGRALNWLPSGGADAMVYLTPSAPAAAGAAAAGAVTYFDPNSTLDGHWNNTIGAAPTYPPKGDVSYHVLGDLVFRFEYCFLLKDGSYSDYPVEQNANNVSSQPLASGNNVTAMSTHAFAPTSNDDSYNSGGHGPYSGTGSRWLDSNAGRVYLSTNGGTVPGTAVWSSLGLQDVTAVIVSIAVLDRDSRTLLLNTGGTAGLVNLANQFVDSAAGLGGAGFIARGAYTPPAVAFMLPQQVWQNALDNNTIALAGVPAGIAAQVLRNVRIYQRYIYLNPAVPTS